MERRQFLVGAGCAITATIAGCTGGSSGPEGTVEEFYSRVDDGDLDGAEELLHPDSDESFDDEDPDEFEELDIDVTETEEILNEDDEAIVEVTIAISGELFGEEFEEEETAQILLRESDGDWLIVEEGDRVSAGSAPQATLGLECSDGDVVLSHRGGDFLSGDEVVDEGDGSFDPDEGELAVGEQTTLIESSDGETTHTLVHEPTNSVIREATANCS